MHATFFFKKTREQVHFERLQFLFGVVSTGGIPPIDRKTP